MRTRIDLLPRQAYDGELVVLVDILRGCTVAPILFDNGMERLCLTGSLREARRIASDGEVLLGERAGVPPEGFNHPGSPAALSPLDFSGKRGVMISDNLPRALSAVAGAKRVLLASLYNAGAVARTVIESGAERICLVCAAYQGQEDLDDTLAAGFLAAELDRLSTGGRLEGASRLALGLLRAFPDPLEGLWNSTAGRELRRLELADDLAMAAMVSQSESVPELVRVDRGERSDHYYFEAATGR